MRLHALLFGLAVWAHGAQALPSENSAVEARAVLLRLSPSELTAAEASALVRVLEADLNELGMVLRVEYSAEVEANWFSQPREGSALLLASLQVSETQGWRVSLLDPKGQQAAVRELPGGPERNAAALEAVAAILVSAATTLAQGEDATLAPAPTLPPEDATKQPPVAAQPPPKTPPPTPQRDTASKRNTSSFWGLRASLGVSATTFENSAPVTFGPELTLGTTLGHLALLEASGSRHLSARIETSRGAFDVVRSQLWLRGGPRFEPAPWELAPVFGVGLESLERAQGDPLEGANALPAHTSLRWALSAALRARYHWSSWGTIDASVATAIFPQSLHLVADDTEVLAAPWSVAGSAFLGIGFAL